MNRYTRIKDDEAFHAARELGVGASDIPTLAGLNKRWGQTPLTLWREKTGRAEGFAGNERTEWGNALEPLVLRRWVLNHYGHEAAQEFYRNATRADPVSSGPFKVKTEAFHPERRYCLAHADLVVDWGKELAALPANVAPKPHLVEAKTTGYFSGKRREGLAFEGYDPDDCSQFGVPDKVFMQVQWQMFCYGVESATVAVLIDTADYREYGPIIFDPRHVEKSLALAERFWHHVTTDTEPAPTSFADAVSIFPELANTTAMVSGEAEMEARRMIEEGRELKARAKGIDDKLEDIKAALAILAGGNTVLAASDGEPLAKLSTRTRESLTVMSAELKAKVKKRAELTPKEIEIVAIDAKLRELGCYRESAPWREVRY